MSTEIESIRALLGVSAAFWAGDGGVRVEREGWAAFSGCGSVDYNVAFCVAGGEAVDRRVEQILAARVPAVLMIAGAALAEVQRLVERSWVCIGATPVMSVELTSLGESEPKDTAIGTRRLAAGDLDAARALVSRVFDINDELARIALRDPGPDHPGRQVWGAFDEQGGLRACLGLSMAGDSAAVWSMATDPDARRQGYARGVLHAALRSAARAGATRSILYASAAGEPFYRRLGYREHERWQMWSRPRWVLGRA